MGHPTTGKEQLNNSDNKLGQKILTETKQGTVKQVRQQLGQKILTETKQGTVKQVRQQTGAKDIDCSKTGIDGTGEGTVAPHRQ